MKSRVQLQRLAKRDLWAVYRRVTARAPATAARWLNRFERTLQTLDERPDRCPLAHESAKVRIDVRVLLFGRSPNVFRVLFTVGGDAVRILRIRRAQRRFLSRGELEESLSPDDEAK
jgi:ParE-like toxin of type II ParDE toxin-antitoxin system